MEIIMKRIPFILICCGMLLFGFFVSEYNSVNDREIIYNEDIAILDTTETDTSGLLLEPLATNDECQNEVEQYSIPVLTDSEREFLEKHLYGQWRFSEIIFELKENNINPYDYWVTISEQGMEELKQKVVIEYSEDIFWIPVRIRRDMFSDPRDAFLFGAMGGFNWIQNPIYHIEHYSYSIDHLRSRYSNSVERLPLTTVENLVRVSYHINLSDSEDIPKLMLIDTNRLFASVIYIDPNDEDTIYVDFSGLWKMERDYENYGTRG